MAHNVYSKYALTQYRVVLLASYTRGLTLGRPPPTSGAQDGYHGNTGFLGTGRRNLHFIIEYIKNPKAYKLQNKHISSRCGTGHMIQFGESGSKI